MQSLYASFTGNPAGLSEAQEEELNTLVMRDWSSLGTAEVGAMRCADITGDEYGVWPMTLVPGCWVVMLVEQYENCPPAVFVASARA